MILLIYNLDFLKVKKLIFMVHTPNLISNLLRLVVIGFVFISLFKSPQLDTVLWALPVLYGACTPLRLHLQNKKENL